MYDFNFSNLNLWVSLYSHFVSELQNSIYIDIPRRFWNSANGDYKIQSHGK